MYIKLFLCLFFFIQNLMGNHSSISQSQPRSQDDAIKSAIEKTLALFIKKYEIPGIAVVLYVHEKPYLFHRGYADKKKKTPVIEKTLFEIGSISKLFTCLLVAQEVLNGRMKLSDPIGSYIPSLSTKDALKRMSLERLCTHTSGLPCDLSDKVTSQQDFLRYLLKWHPPLEKSLMWSYSNTGIELLRIALEELSGEIINNLLITKLLLPLGMSPIGITVPESYKIHCATGYDKNGKQAPQWDNPFLLGSAAVRVSSSDMLHFLKAALGLQDVPTHIKDAIRMTQTATVMLKEFRHGLGWQITPLNITRTFNGFNQYPIQCIKEMERCFSTHALLDKGGTTHGFHAYIATIPAHKAGVVVMINRRLPHGWKVINDLGRKILYQSLDLPNTNTVKKVKLSLQKTKKTSQRKRCSVKRNK